MNELQIKANNAYLVCEKCGLLFGNVQAQVAAEQFRMQKCGVCGRRRLVADFKHYGFSKYQNAKGEA